MESVDCLGVSVVRSSKLLMEGPRASAWPMSSSLFAECAGKASGRAGSLFRLATLDLERQHSTRLSHT